MRTFTLALAATALLAAAPAASAADYTVTGGKLDWTMANQYAAGGDAARTWLGYVTNTAPVAGAPAAGTVDADRARDGDRPDGAAVTVIDGDLRARRRPALHAQLPGRGRAAGPTPTRASARSS